MRGLSEAYGSWKTICSSRRSGAQLARRRCVEHVLARRSRPCPTSARSAAGRSRPVVDLPQPDSPTRPSVSPGVDVKRHAGDRLHAADRRGRRRRRGSGSSSRDHVARSSSRIRRRRGAVGEPRSCGSCRRRSRTRQASTSASSVARRSGTPTRWLGAVDRLGAAGTSCSSARAPARGAARVERRSPGGRQISDGGCALDRAEPLAPSPVEPRQRRQQPDACTGGAARRRSRRRRPARPARPAYITSTRSATPATTPRSWVIRMIADAGLAPGCRSSTSRTCAWIVTSSAVVGSSAMSSVGLVGDRHRDHRPLAHAAGELVRVLLAPAARGSGCRPGRAARSRARTACAFSFAGATSIASAIWSPTVNTGFSDGQRVLEDHRDARRRGAVRSSLLAHRRAGRVRRNDHLAVTIGAAAAGAGRGSPSSVTVLPEPDSPTMPSVSPRDDVVADAVDRVHDAVVGRELCTDEVA